MKNYMTYTHYIRKNGLKDSIETYEQYVMEHEEIATRQNQKMFKQYINATYRFRFINSAWC